MHTITLVSAVSGDRVGHAVELSELEPPWATRPEVWEFLQVNNYDPDHPDELIYVLDGEDAPAGFPTLTIRVSATEVAEIRKALTTETEGNE